jgi:hypothetical protein
VGFPALHFSITPAPSVDVAYHVSWANLGCVARHSRGLTCKPQPSAGQRGRPRIAEVEVRPCHVAELGATGEQMCPRAGDYHPNDVINGMGCLPHSARRTRGELSLSIHGILDGVLCATWREQTSRGGALLAPRGPWQLGGATALARAALSAGGRKVIPISEQSGLSAQDKR